MRSIHGISFVYQAEWNNISAIDLSSHVPTE